MAVGVDIGATGARTIDSHQASIAHSVPPARRRLVADLATRVGDPVPMIGWDEAGRPTPTQAHDLYAEEVARALVSCGLDVAQHDGRGVVVATPAWWTSQATSATRAAIRALVGRKARIIPDAEAAVRGHVAAGGSPEEVQAVLDVGARTTSAAVVAGCTSGRPRLVGRSAVHVDGGGDDLDRRLLHHLLDTLHDQDRPPPRSAEAARLLLNQTREVKHALSTRSATDLTTDLTGDDTALRLVRDELDEIARPWVEVAVTALRRAIDASGLPVGTVLLVGGGAHVPLVAQTISAELRIDVVVGDNPDLAVATGAMASAGGADHQMRSARRRRPHRWTQRMVSTRRGGAPVGQVLALPQPNHRKSRVLPVARADVSASADTESAAS